MKTVTASLEDMRIVVDEAKCALEKYEFAADKWLSRYEGSWPLSRPPAERWLAGWDSIDRFAVRYTLTPPQGDVGSKRPPAKAASFAAPDDLQGPVNAPVRG
jgi:hypothetical protein